MNRTLAWLAAVGALAFACKGDPKPPKAPTKGAEANIAAASVPKTRRFEIVDDGQVYPSINTSDCLRWPNADAKALGGEDAWGSYEPSNGTVGELVAVVPHCSSPVLVHILRVGQFYIPVGESGLRELGADGDVGIAGGTVGGTVGKPAAAATYEVVDAGQLYSTINTTDCLDWPSESIKSQAGMDAWGSFYPKNGDVGTLIGTATHCDSGVTVHILEIRGYYAAIGASGLRQTTGGGAPVPGKGKRYEITDAGQLYSTINTTDCLTWPSESIKSQAGMDAWGSFYPKNGDVGTLVGTSKHCSAGTTVLILEIRGNYAAIGASGLKELR